ncbi:MAG: hypothetical protein CM15mP77_1400 [Synechococcus sp.]|nr:MAG: hypothetical protein CM15mP77_1400 [Synechococcus sp.]
MIDCLELQKQLCERLSHCPMLLPADSGEALEDQGSGQQIWIELISPLEPVWLRSELPNPRRWPPDPMLMVIALVGAVILTVLFICSKRLNNLSVAWNEPWPASVKATTPAALPAQGSPRCNASPDGSMTWCSAWLPIVGSGQRCWPASPMT